MSKVFFAVALGSLIATTGWAVPKAGTAHFQRSRSGDAGRPIIPFHDVNGRGLLVKTWFGDCGPLNFVLDTGAGVSIIGKAVVKRCGLMTRNSTNSLAGGLSNARIDSGEEATLPRLALGTVNNNFDRSIVAVVVNDLPSGVDGVLDPTEAFHPFGYAIDFPHHELTVFDSVAPHLNLSEQPEDGTVVRWIREHDGNRPFVYLGDGRLALIDTGSAFGFAITYAAVSAHRRTPRAIQDLSGASIQSKRVAPTTITIGELVLHSVPTDVLTGVSAGAPLLLGRDALYPFRITFDPAAKLIAIEPASR
ncbi:MAG: aspartyl protease family protein [Pyrinomonadaceae bacterium]